MKLTPKLKWIAAVSVLAVGIPVAGMAVASSVEHQSITKPVVATQQVDKKPAMFSFS